MRKDEKLANDICQIKGSCLVKCSSPIKDEGYNLSKQIFFDALAVRYRWSLKRLPFKCSCSNKPVFDADHAMSCLTGGFIHKRHDGIRDIIAQAMRDV